MERKNTGILPETQLAMTSKEILKADMLDIVFESRNKNYGAYELRKHYNARMIIALSGMLGIVLMIVMIVSLNPEVREAIADIVNDRDTVTLTVLPSPPPEQPLSVPPPQANLRQIDYDRFEIIDEPTTVPTQTDIGAAVISNATVDGADPDGSPFNSIESGTINEPAIIEYPPSTLPPAISSAATFPGGQQAWMNFLNRHLRTPGELETGQKRNVMVRFAVAADGSVTQFEIVQSGGVAFDNEVIRVLKKMPKWKPAVQNGHNVSVMFTQPVTFMAFEE